jgi:tetratricopeptide (TPR) repeat protein
VLIVMKTLAFIVLAAAALAAQDRLDTTRMRNDLFAGLAGNQEAIARMLVASEKMLAEFPDSAQALVWHGVASLARSFQLLQGNQDAGMAAFQKAIGEMDRAVELAPDDIEVRALRGVLLAPLSRQMPEPFTTRMLEKARSDYQRLYDIQEKELQTLVTHPLGELLQGLGDIYSRQAKPAEAEKYYGKILEMLKDTEYARRAAAWMETRQPLPAAQTACVGCHTRN